MTLLIAFALVTRQKDFPPCTFVLIREVNSTLWYFKHDIFSRHASNLKNHLHKNDMVTKNWISANISGWPWRRMCHLMYMFRELKMNTVKMAKVHVPDNNLMSRDYAMSIIGSNASFKDTNLQSVLFLQNG